MVERYSIVSSYNMGKREDGFWVEYQDYQRLETELAECKAWINDLQSGMYINCVYCGHRYGPRSEVPASMADVLKEHISICPKHPMSALRARCERLEGALRNLLAGVMNLPPLTAIVGVLEPQCDDAREALEVPRG